MTDWEASADLASGAVEGSPQTQGLVRTSCPPSSLSLSPPHLVMKDFLRSAGGWPGATDQSTRLGQQRNPGAADEDPAGLQGGMDWVLV